MADIFFFDEVEKWLYSFTYDIMNAEQEYDSMSKLLTFVDMAEGVCSKVLVMEVRNYIRTSFELDLWRLCFRHYKESYNALTYREGQGGCKSNNKLDKAAKKLLSLSGKRFEKLRAKVERDLNITKVARKGELTDQAEIDLSKEVVPRMFDKSLEQWKQGCSNYKCCDPSQWCVSISAKHEIYSLVTNFVVSTASSESCVLAPAMSPVKVGSKRSSDETPSGRFRHQQNRKTDPAVQAGNIAYSQVDVSPEEPPSVTRTTTASATVLLGSSSPRRDAVDAQEGVT